MASAKQILAAQRKNKREHAARKVVEMKSQGLVRRAYWLTPEQHDELAETLKLGEQHANN